jgi:hypothetical protein
MGQQKIDLGKYVDVKEAVFLKGLGRMHAMHMSFLIFQIQQRNRRRKSAKWL